MLGLAYFLAASVAWAGPITVVTTIPDLAAITTAIGGDLVRVETIDRGLQDPHFVDPKPSLLLKLSRADVLVEVGLELEVGWMPSLLRSARNRKILPGQPGFVDASRGLHVLEKPEGQVSRAEGDVHPYGNPHYWLDPANGEVIANNIEQALSRVDPGHAEQYARGRDAFIAKLKDKIVEWEDRMKPYRGTECVSYHRSWIYFAERFGLVSKAEIEPKPGIPPAPGHTLDVIRTIKERNIPLIIEESFFDSSTARDIAGKTGATFLELPCMVGGAKGINDNFDLFDYLTIRIADSLASRGIKEGATR